MDRRNFFKISAVTAGGITLEGCGHPETKLIRFLPEDEITPGLATWKTSLCRQCDAGCGVLVRLMDGEVGVVRDGEHGLLPMKLAKKLEGNPAHPISQGKLCARGQAGLQVTYNPDRIRTPLRRTGPRGTGQYEEISWEKAIGELSERLRELQREKEERSLVFLSSPLRGQRRKLVDRFLAAFRASERVEYEFFSQAVLWQANHISFGQEALPTFDIGRSNYLLSFGADFLGTWLSPVAQAVGFGQMRRGRPGRRGKFVQVESRMTPTGGIADEWVAIRPGTDGVLALGLAHIIMKEGLVKPSAAGQAGRVIDEWNAGLPGYPPEKVEEITGIKAERIERLARSLGNHLPALILIGGPSLAHTNGLFHALAVNALNALLGSVETPGGLFFSPQPPLASMPRLPSRRSKSVWSRWNSVKDLADQILSSQPFPIRALLLSEADPIFSAPSAWQIREAIDRVPFIASFGTFLDETSSLADLILPDHTPLESWQDDVPVTGTFKATVSLSAPAMKPLFSTRAMPDTLLALAQQLGSAVEKAMPWKNFEERLKEALRPLAGRDGSSIKAEDFNDFWSQALEQGGWWGEVKTPRRPRRRRRRTLGVQPLKFEEPKFEGTNQEFPFYFQPYASQGLYDGRHANLPWLQEMPELLSTVRWGTWIEINPHTAERLGLHEGDLVAVKSSQGSLEAPVLIYPGIAPDLLAMPMGQGHENSGRVAKDHGANPASLLAPLSETATGALAWAATRVRLRKVGTGRLIKAGGSLEERPIEQFPR